MMTSFMKVADIAAITQFKAKFVRNHASKTERTGTWLFGHKVGGQWRFRREDVEDWLRRMAFPVPQEM